MFEYTADDLFSIVTSSDYPQDQKLKIVLDLKQYIKKYFVDLTEVTRYFEALKYAIKSADYQYSTAAFGTVCHLVKRVGMQDLNALRGCSKIVLPVLVNKLLDDKTNTRLQAKKTLETYWLATPSAVENFIRDNALIHSNPRIRSEGIVFISDLIDLSQNFNFTTFLPNLVNLLHDDFTEVVKNVQVLLIKYYTLNKAKVQELIKELKTQKIERKIAVPIIKELDPILSNSYTIESKPAPLSSRTTIDTFNNLSRMKRSTSSIGTRTKIPTAISSVSRASMVPMSTTGSSSTFGDIDTLLNGIPTTKLDTNIKPIVVHSAADLRKDIELLLAPFEGRETEFNWGNREKNIIKFRGLVTGNSKAYPDDLIQATRSLQDGIFKTISSLRTTLSANGCQLAKELAVHLNKHLDPIAEILFQPLASLTSSTKKIASSNAYGSLCVLLNNTSFNSRLLNQCHMLYQDKNTQPRLYSSTFLQILILRHSAKIDQLNLETIVKWISKGVTDPNTTVRESMRGTFWLFYRKFKDSAETIYQKQDAAVKKALDRAKPSGVESFHGSSAPGGERSTIAAGVVNKRPSIRDFVAAKHREKKVSSSSLQSEEFPSNSTSSQHPINELGKPSRISTSQRSIRASSAGSIMPSQNEPLPQKLSRGSLRADYERASYIQGAPSRVSSLPDERTRLELSPDINESEDYLMLRFLKSPLTKERVEGLNILKKLLTSNTTIPDLSKAINNLMIIDYASLKPFLNDTKFFGAIDIDLAIKVLALSREGLDILHSRYSVLEISQALIDLVELLDNVRFGTAPSTMFHIKHKAHLLNYCIQQLYKLSEKPSFSPSIQFYSRICSIIFPLSISDYSGYDELLIQLFQINQDLFEQSLENSSSFTQSSIKSILMNFKDDFNKTIHSHSEGGDNRLNEMTMINPLARKATDPTLSLQPGFRTDMTMIVPELKQPNNAQISDNIKDNEINDDKMDVDVDEKKRLEYMGDIFEDGIKRTKEESPSYPTDDEKMDLDANRDLSKPLEELCSNSVAQDAVKLNHGPPDLTSKSPLIDRHADDDDGSDDPTTTIANQISDIYISPEKRPIGSRSPKRRSISEIIHETDPFFIKDKKKFSIFEDESADTHPKIESNNHFQKLTDLYLSQISKLDKVENISVQKILDLLQSFVDDAVNESELHGLMFYLHCSVDSEDITLWLRSEGFELIVNTLLNYFRSSDKITTELCFKGLIIFKELLILDRDLTKMVTLNQSLEILGVLFMITDNLKDFKNEIYVTVDELIDNLLELKIDGLSNEIITKCLDSLKETESSIMVVFLLLTLTKTLGQGKELRFEQIKDIDEVVYNFIADDELEIRRLSVISYSKLMKNLKDLQERKGFSEGNSFQNKVSDLEYSVFRKLTAPERKLVEYYWKHAEEAIKKE